jgi:tRNA U34 5-methylaminomethyl-2-thiouridine-forming methyltransferase MnmC
MQSAENKFSNREVITTKDGSNSIAVPASGLTYHSTNGAIRESMHVFIGAGLRHAVATDELKIFEMGLGTGLNALLTLMEAERLQKKIYYESVEAYPLEKGFIQQLNYCQQLNYPGLQPSFEKIHSCNWNEETSITPLFQFKKSPASLEQYQTPIKFNVIYFDAFAPRAQPELWTKEIFEKLHAMLVPGGIFVTYSSKGSIRRNLVAAGFAVEKIPGPPGKREMVRAIKSS